MWRNMKAGIKKPKKSASIHYFKMKYQKKNISRITLALLNKSLIRAEPTPTKTSTNSDPAIW